MHHKTKFITVLLCFCLIFFSAGCGDDKKEKPSQKQHAIQTIPAASQPAASEKMPADQASTEEATQPVKDEKIVPQKEPGQQAAQAQPEPDTQDTTEVTSETEDTQAPESPEEPASQQQGTDESVTVSEPESVDIEKIKEMSGDIKIGFETTEPATEAFSKEQEQYTTYDPFAPLFKKSKAEPIIIKEDAGPQRILTPLEKISLGQLKLKGIIISTKSGNRAIVTDASGKGYVIKKGTYIGLNSGRVEEILDDKVIIKEKAGGRELKAELELQKETGE